jgi:hypothetical protein
MLLGGIAPSPGRRRRPGRIARCTRLRSRRAQCDTRGPRLAFLTAPAFMTNDTGPANLDPKTYRMIGDLGYEIWVAAVIVGAVLVWATSALALRTDVLPRWFGWLGLLVGLILLFAIVFVPAFVYAGWIVLAAALLTWLPTRAASPAVPQAACCIT